MVTVSTVLTQVLHKSMYCIVLNRKAGDVYCCNISLPSRVSANDYSNAVSVSNILCSRRADCVAILGEDSYCYAQKCACVADTAILVDGACVPVDFCNRVSLIVSAMLIE